MNEKKLNAAFRAARSVILVFSVRESGKFQGTFSTNSGKHPFVVCFKDLNVVFFGCRFCTFVIGVQSRWISHPLGSSCRHERQDAGRRVQDRLALQVHTYNAVFFPCFVVQSTDYLFFLPGGSFLSPKRLTCPIPGTNTSQSKLDATDRFVERSRSSSPHL